MPKLNDQRHFVAWIDILGFRSLMERPTAEAAFRLGEYLESALETARDVQTHVPEIWPNREIHVSSIQAHAFQDTIVLWADKKNLAGFAGVVQVAYALYAICQYKQGLPLRGAISEGTLYSNRDKGILVGTGPLDAHRWESSQQWAGLVISPELVLESPEVLEWLSECEAQGTMVRFIAPLKDRHLQELWCLGWPKECPSNYEAAIEEKLVAQVGQKYPVTQNSMYFWNWWRKAHPQGWDFHSRT